MQTSCTRTADSLRSTTPAHGPQPWRSVTVGSWQSARAARWTRGLQRTRTSLISRGASSCLGSMTPMSIRPTGTSTKKPATCCSPAELDQDGIADSLRSFAAANPDREWIRAEKYGLGAFPDGKLTKVFLDAVVPDRPALVYDEGFHGAGVNSKALEIAGLTKETPDPPLGFIDRDPETGELTGYLAETGIGLVARHITRVDKQSLRRATDRALAEMTASGITAFIDMMGYEDLLAIYRDLEAAVRLPFRVVVALGMNEFTGEVITAGEAAMLVGHLNDYSNPPHRRQPLQVLGRRHSHQFHVAPRRALHERSIHPWRNDDDAGDEGHGRRADGRRIERSFPRQRRRDGSRGAPPRRRGTATFSRTDPAGSHRPQPDCSSRRHPEVRGAGSRRGVLATAVVPHCCNTSDAAVHR